MDEKAKQIYCQAYADWQSQLKNLHKVLLDGEKLSPPKLKGLLNREIRAKKRYDQARCRLLGLSVDKD